ncbi:MAG: hypothetical protein CMG75_03120 [Candidatus Marinimicrobia bacterium]|nr:hypothetical protein [Candidatus Neomarinimicrobiota bacterium]
MNIIILHGPNMNLFGLRSANNDERITLDKINRSLKHEARKLNTTLKIFQTQSIAKGINFIHRNRNTADGCIITPCAWSRNGFELLDAIAVCRIPTVEVQLNIAFDSLSFGKNSIFSKVCICSETGNPYQAYSSALATITTYLNSD